MAKDRYREGWSKGYQQCQLDMTDNSKSALSDRVRPAVCEWRKNGDYDLPGHDTSCGEEYVFDAAPLEDMLGDSYIYCPKCGGEIQQV